MILLMSVSAHAQEIYIYNGNGDVPVDQVNYAAWDWNQKLGSTLHYAGPVHVGYIENAITIRVGSWTEWKAAAFPANTLGVANQSHGTSGCEIVIAPAQAFLYGISQDLIAHEIGHCAGAWVHSNDTFDTMFNVSQANGITQNDAALVIKSPTWPAANAPSLCHATMNAAGKLLIPEISGYEGHLQYIGNVNGIHTWKPVLISHYNGQTCPGNKLLPDGTVTLNEVRYYGTGNFSVVLHSAKGLWELVAAYEISIKNAPALITQKQGYMLTASPTSSPPPLHYRIMQ